MTHYTYESAATEEYPDKKGVNRLTWEGERMIMKEYFAEDPRLKADIPLTNWTEFTREYFPVDPRTQPSIALQAIMQATPQEIVEIKKILGIN